MDTINEKELLRGAQAFEMDSLATIYDTFSPAIYTYSQRLLGNEALSEDCVAETFSRFLHAIKNGYGPDKNLRAYLYRIAHNWITDYYRRHHPDQPGDEQLEQIADCFDVHSLVEKNISRGQVRTALLHLPEQQRQVIILRYLEGWEHSEIAQSLGKSVNAVKVIQHRAVQTLRKRLSEKEG